MTKIAVVTHCWAVKHAFYATMLRAQLTSFYKQESPGMSRIVVAVDPSDHLVTQVISEFSPFLDVRLHTMYFSPREMWRRCITRNAACIADTDSGLIWFTDCDYIFGRACLQTVWNLWEAAGFPDLTWPTSYSANENKDDLYLTMNQNKKGQLPIDFPATWQMSNNRAIGGLQIVKGEFARKHGYIPNHKKYQTLPDVPFPDTKDDACYRRELLKIGTGKTIGPLPSLYRIRHTEVGYGSQKMV